MPIPFALAYAQARTPEAIAPYAYDPAVQMNRLADGTLAVDNTELLTALGATSSTAGSKTHQDD